MSGKDGSGRTGNDGGRRGGDNGRQAKSLEALTDAISSIEKSYGKGSIMRLGDGAAVVPVQGISTGSLALDIAVGGRGFPRGRVIEVFGPESSGKTTLTLHVVANAQKGGGLAGFIDAEHALDPQYARKLGVDLDGLLISQPDNGEQALDICETLVRSAALDVIVIDSVAALVPRAEIEGEMGDTFVGLQARLMSQALRKLTGLVAKSNTCLIFINQIREKIGVMFGSPETTTGGRALKFYSSVRIDIRRIGQIKNGDLPVGARTKATVVKNKVAPPFRKVEFDILFNEGINRLGELIDLGVESGALKRSGTWLSYGDDRLGQGRDRAKEFLVENEAIVERLRKDIVTRLAPHVVEDAAKPAVAAAPAKDEKDEKGEPKAPVEPARGAAQKAAAGASDAAPRTAAAQASRGAAPKSAPGKAGGPASRQASAER